MSTVKYKTMQITEISYRIKTGTKMFMSDEKATMTLEGFESNSLIHGVRLIYFHNHIPSFGVNQVHKFCQVLVIEMCFGEGRAVVRIFFPPVSLR